MKKLALYKARKIVETTLNNGGYSFNEYHDGYMVSLDGTECQIKLRENKLDDIAYQVQEYFDKFNTVNTWLENDTIYLDLSVNIKNLDQALEIARHNKQLAIYDCKAKNVIELA